MRRSLTIAECCTFLDGGTPFAFSRWGDGEWQALLAYSGSTCDGQRYSGALRRDLTRVLESRPTYWLGMQPLALRTMGREIAEWLRRRRLSFHWVNADVLAQASIAHRLEGFVASLARRGVILIGPAHLGALSLFPITAHIEVPLHHAYEAYETVHETSRTAITRHREIVLISAGAAAKVLVHDLHRAYPHRTIIDCGSLWDPFVGVVSRTYHKDLVSCA